MSVAEFGEVFGRDVNVGVELEFVGGEELGNRLFNLVVRSI